MNLLTTFLLAIREVRRHLMRSVLTTLGIVIGVGAVITMITLGRGATEKVTSQISGLGRNLLILMPERASRSGGPPASTAPFKIEDVQAIVEEIADVAVVAPLATRPLLAVYGNENRTTTVTGIDNNFFEVRDWRLSMGRTFSETELRAGKLVCVIGATTRKELFRYQDPIGATLRLGKLACEVIGVLEAKGATFGNDQDEIVLVPLRAFQRRIAGNRDINLVFVGAKSGESTAKVQRDITSLMHERRHISRGEPDDFAVRDMTEVTNTVGAATGILTAFLSAIAAVSLVVGGIGIMNIMLVSVTERTREIGIRMSIGAMEREVLRQFLVEAVTLSLLGGLIGVAGGLGCSALVCFALDLPFILDLSTVFLAFFFSGSVGVVFGYFPARKAARLDPIEALRYE
ncbi:MAG: ABC transporter permease [Verrucomicrobia bacterium]|nr:ABC transporter permease [Verrucomicrobiota bacterium]